VFPHVNRLVSKHNEAYFSPSIAQQSYCRSELLSRSSNNCLRHIRSTLLVTGAGRHGGPARASTPVAQTSALVARVSRSVARRFARGRCSTMHVPMRSCASLSAYRGTAVLFKLLDVLVTAAQQRVPRLVDGFCCAAGFKAHDTESDGGTAIEWCAQCLASR
jgi:hypothetical protein